jgi:hypothetical protein
VSAILASSSTRVLLNGRSGDRICHAKGLRQGDSLSLLLFVLVMEVLSALIRLLTCGRSLSRYIITSFNIELLSMQTIWWFS